MGYYEMHVCWNLLFSILNCKKIKANKLEQLSYFIIGMRIGSNQCLLVFDF
jgi:hypothetical protein